MRQYRPTIQELQKRYAKDRARKEMVSLLLKANPARANKHHVPYKAETLLGHPPRSVAECAWLNEQIMQFHDSQRARFIQIHSCWQ